MLNNKIEVKKGSVLNTSFQVVAHQTNCQGVMGSGVAKVIKQAYPNVYEEYKDYCDDCESEALGNCQLVDGLNGKYIANLFGQDSYGTHARQTNYKALYSALKDLRASMELLNLRTLSFPYMIGCGLAGGDANTVLSLIKEVFDDSDIIYNFYDINNAYVGE